jgi:hypothetical protein
VGVVANADRTVSRACDSSSADLICGLEVPVPGTCRTTRLRNALSAAMLFWHSSRIVLSSEDNVGVSGFGQPVSLLNCPFDELTLSTEQSQIVQGLSIDCS